MIAHGWSGGDQARYLVIDPASGTDASGKVLTSGYNDFGHLRWLGGAQSANAEQDQAHVGQWSCYEFHVRLNDAGQSNGVFELSVNGQPSAQRTGLDWVGGYRDYGINAIFLEQFTNDGAPAANVRTFDNFVVSTQPIGCGQSPATSAAVATVAVSLDTSSLTPGQRATATAIPRDASGNALTGRAIVWSSSNASVAKVDASGQVTAVKPGTARIKATSEGKSGSAPVTVVRADTLAPRIVIAAPTESGKTYRTTSRQIAVSGTATDNIGVARVQWKSDGGESGDASGTSRWNIAAVRLRAGANVITVSALDSSNNVATATITAVLDSLAPATQLSVTQQPSASATSGVAFAQQPSVQLRDSKGVPVSQSDVPVSVTIASGGGSLAGTTTATTNASGVASFKGLAITGVSGTRTLRFSSGTLAATTSNQINVTAGGASKFVISTIGQQVAGRPFSVTATLVDANGNAVPNTGNVGTVTLSTESGSGTLGGTVSKPLAVGSSVLTFGSVTHSQAQSGVILRVVGSGAGSGVAGKTGSSNAFSVVAASATVPSGGATPLVVEDFSSYGNTSDLDASSRWISAEKRGAQYIAIDNTVGYGSSSRSLRYDWPNNGSKAGEITIHPGFLRIPGSQTHVWVEFVARFSPNFAVNAGVANYGAEYKLAALLDYGGGQGRWNVPEMQEGRWVSGYPGNEAGFISSTPTPQSIWDGQPHVFRVEAKLGPSGIFRFWIDGKIQVDQSGFQTASSHRVIDAFAPGLNLNQGPRVSGMKMWWHRIAVYNSDPGWR
jgi:hypothetical protein